jgi:hypothetical protein
MPQPGKLRGRYNLVVAEEFDLFDHRVPVDEFITLLRNDDVPDELCVVGLAEAFQTEDEVADLRRQMTDQSEQLEGRSPLPAIQFAVDGSFQRRDRDFELKSGDELHRLSRVFKGQIQRKKSGWLTAPF